MIKFKKVRFKNFFNFGNEFTEINITDFNFVCITGNNGCIVGDSIINFNRAKNGFKMSIERAFKSFNHKYKGNDTRNWNLNIPTYVRSYNGNEIRLHKIQNIVKSGIKIVYEIKLENGNSLKATNDHKIMTKNGWKKLCCLNINTDFVMCDTLNAKKKKSDHNKLQDKEIYGIIYHKYAKKNTIDRSKGKLNTEYYRLPMHRLIYEAYYNNLLYDDFIYILKHDKEKAKKLKFINPKKYVIHHKDFDHYNNDINNLKIMENKKHQILHGKINYKNFNQGIPIFSKIEHIVHCEDIQETYDIICEEPHRNFVVNEMVIHNSGKSSIIIESIFFGLFGKSFRKINKPNIVNNINKKNCEVHLWFQKNNKNYYIKRGIKPNVLDVFEEENQIESKSSETELQSYIEEKILQFNEKIFKQVCLFGSELYTPFLNLTLPERRFIIENLLGLEVFSSMQSIIKDKIKEITIKINEDENKMNRCSSELKILNDTLAEVQKDNKAQIKQYNDSITQLQNIMKEYSDRKEILTKDVENLIIDVDKVNKSAEKYKKQLSEGTEMRQTRITEIKGYQTQNTIYEGQLGKLEGKSECPLCHSKADNFKSILDDLKKNIEENNIKMEKLKLECKEINKISEEVQEKYDVYDKKIDNLNDNLGEKKREMSVNDTKKENCETTINEYENKIKEFENKTIIDESDIKNKEDIINECKIVLKEKQEMLKYYNYIKLITSDKGIKSYIIQKYIPIINNKINYYLDKFELGFYFEFNDQFEDKILSRFKEGIVFNGLSAGQKESIGFSILFSFVYISQLLNSINCDVLFMDEILDSSLDEENSNKLLKIIKDVCINENKKAFIITHKENMKDKFNEYIDVSWNGLFGIVKFN